MWPFLKRQWFLLALVTVLFMGISFPAELAPLARVRALRNWIVATVLFLMALPLNTDTIARSIRAPQPALLGSIVNMAFLPGLAWLLSHLLEGDMRTGLLIAAAVPSTLASAAVWTRKAGGDATVAVLVTAITNLTCFATTPFLLYITTGNAMTVDHQAELARMPLRLGLLVVLPMGLAQLVRQYGPLGDWADHHQRRLSICTQIGMLSMVLAGAAICGSKLADTSWYQLAGFPVMAALAGVLHVVVLVAGIWLATVMGYTRQQQIAVGIAGSQKTLMVGLEIAISYFGGLVILPMITYHFIQLVVDTVVADKLRSGNT